jgi:predicted glycoside hydrolase/deacetylase ChbG (UPF0249 family)
MTRVVVAADDFGLCEEVNEAICLLHDRGVVNRTSLLAHTALFESSIEALRRRPGLEVAVHLNLTDGRPVLPLAQVRTLVDDRGYFPGGRHFGVIAGIVNGRSSRLEIYHEWRAQIAKVRDAGLAPAELNAHGHLHLLPQLHGTVLQLRREFDIPRVRLVRSSEWPRGVLLNGCSSVLSRRLRRDGVPVVRTRTVGLRRPGAIDPRIRLRDLAISRSAGLELIVHPSLRPNAYHRRWGYAGVDVMEWLLGAFAPDGG